MPKIVWNYQTAFSRNQGLVSEAEQKKIKQTRIAIAGMGGVGGVHLITLVRMGFEKFSVADFDVFELQNFNRQYGANCNSVGKSKVEVMIEEARNINPDVDIRIFDNALTKEIVSDFLSDCQIFVDGIDAFEIEIRRHIYQIAKENNIYSVVAGPMGFSTSWLIFSPQGMSFEDYFGFSSAQSDLEKFAAFMIGLSPASLHVSYLDPASVSFVNRKGPSSMLACQLCSGVMAAEVLKIVLARGPLRCAPYYQQFDAYRGILKKGRVWFGCGVNPWLRLKRRIVIAKLKELDKRQR